MVTSVELESMAERDGVEDGREGNYIFLLHNMDAATTSHFQCAIPSDNTEDEVTEKDIVPYVGMEFETEDHAYKFYNMYVGFIDFSIRKDWRNTRKLDKDIVIARRFVCFKEGLKRKKDQEEIKPRKDIRTGCLAQMTIGRESNGKYVVKSFANEHNHDLATPKSRHKLPSQRRISTAQVAEVELASRSGIRQKLIF
ncbi:hypothetical protein Lal_00025889 [Lupinus albus]|nr:hypothetical protein Lal_00025889 [Lupinus albus]